MDQRFFDAFTLSTKNTFREMFGQEARPGSTRELSPADEQGWDVSGLIGLAGEVQGVVALRFPRALVDKLLVGTGVEIGDGDERDQLEGGLVGEITNIVAGSAATSLKGINFEIAPPVVIRGPKHKIGWPAIGPVVSTPFSLAWGNFELDLCVKS
jgi:chemotaxis protein CheX